MPSEKLSPRSGSLQDQLPESWMKALITTVGGRRNLGASGVMAATLAALVFLHDPTWLGALVFFSGLVVAAVMIFTKPKKAVPILVSGKTWFKHINQGLKDFDEVTIYLRHMQAPDALTEPRRAALLSVMNSLARKMAHGKNVLVLTQHLEDGVIDWLSKCAIDIAKREKIDCDADTIQARVRRCVREVRESILDNRSSIYVFAESRVFFTLVNERQVATHYVFYMAGSVIPTLIKLGITHYRDHHV